MRMLRPLFERPLALSDDDNDLVRQLILPDGYNATTQGSFIVDKTAWRMIQMRFERRRMKMLFDYEHQSLGKDYNIRPDGLSPAAGWIHKLEYVKGEGIYAHVKWTERARELIRQNEYMYFSPVIRINEDERVTELISVAVTNTPALAEIEALAAKDTLTRKGDEPMGWKLKDARGGDLLGKLRLVLEEATPEEEQQTTEQVVEEVDEIGALIAELRLAYGLGEDVTPADVLKAAIAKAQQEGEGEGEGEEGEMSQSLKAMRSVLGLNGDAKLKDIVLKLEAQQLSKIDPAEHVKLKEQVAVLTTEKAERDADALLDRLVKERKLNPHDADKMKRAKAMALKNPADFEAIMADAPTVLPEEGEITNDDPAIGSGRERMIRLALKDYDPTSGATKRGWINAKLDDGGEDLLTDAEVEAFTK